MLKAGDGTCQFSIKMSGKNKPKLECLKCRKKLDCGPEWCVCRGCGATVQSATESLASFRRPISIGAKLAAARLSNYLRPHLGGHGRMRCVTIFPRTPTCELGCSIFSERHGHPCRGLMRGPAS